MDPQPMWSNVVRNQLPPTAVDHLSIQSMQEMQPASRISVKSCVGISTAVVDANAVIDGAEKLNGMADRFVTIPEVLSEIRDPVSRHRLAFIPFTIQTMEPTPESLSKVVKFARATGDLQTLSEVDLKLLALTYTLEAQTYGIAHLRNAPPPVQTINVKRLPEKDMPGWGCPDSSSGWEVLENEENFHENTQVSSKILPLKSISLDVSEGRSDHEHKEVENDSSRRGDGSFDGSATSVQVGNRSFPSRKKVVTMEGKTVAEGVDASMGQYGDIVDEWSPAVNRSTRRRYLRRKARFEYFQSLSKKCGQDGTKDHQVKDVVNGSHNYEEASAVDNVGRNVSDALEKLVLDEVPLHTVQNGDSGDESINVCVEAVEKNEALDHFEDSDLMNNSFNASVGDGDIVDGSTKKSQTLSDSSVACVTNDFAMQNVLIQMGLRLLSPGGNTIRQLHRWVLKCHACFTITAEIGRIFCPKCGNGGTLRKVAVTVGESGVVLTSRKQRIILRGTKFSLPLPQGGRDAISKNPILREDQLPPRFLHAKSKKKASKEGDDFFTADSVLNNNHTDKSAPFRPPMRKAISVYGGRRNPNDNHYSIRKH